MKKLAKEAEKIVFFQTPLSSWEAFLIRKTTHNRQPQYSKKALKQLSNTYTWICPNAKKICKKNKKETPLILSALTYKSERRGSWK